MKMIPPSVEQFPSNAEKKIFEKMELESSFPGWTCFHSFGIARHEYKHEGEADFILIGPQGLFVLEVKGGDVAQRKDGMWIFTNRYGRSNEKKESPFKQAQSAMYSIRDDLIKKFGKRIDAYAFGYGVVFPDMEFTVTSPEWDSAIVMDCRSMDKPIGRFLERMISYWESRPGHRTGIGDSDLREITNYMRGDFELIRRISIDIKRSEDELLQLTEGQYMALDSLASNKRLIFSGPAGTGKTLLAIEKARRNASRGIKTLYICYNRLLASYLRAVVKNEGISGCVTVDSLHHFFRSKIHDKGLSKEMDSAIGGCDLSTQFKTFYPEYFMRAWGNDPPAYSELIIDEGQDILLPEYIAAIDQTFEGGFDAGKWAIFLDPDYQKKLYDSFDEKVFEELNEYSTSFTLGVNCRNTKPIAIHAEIISGYPMAEVRRVEGLPVNYLWYKDRQEEAQYISDAINRMLADGIAPEDITILSPKSAHLSIAKSDLLRIRVPLIELEDTSVSEPRNGKIAYASVSAYKGLESSIVILTDIEEIESEWMKAVNYVGFSRARSGLWVCMENSMRKSYKRLFAQVAVNAGGK